MVAFERVDWHSTGEKNVPHGTMDTRSEKKLTISCLKHSWHERPLITITNDYFGSATM